MGKEEGSTAKWLFGTVSAVCLTGVVITAMVLNAPAAAAVTVGVAVGGVSGSVSVNKEKSY